MRSVVDRNVVMRRMTVHTNKSSVIAFIKTHDKLHVSAM